MDHMDGKYYHIYIAYMYPMGYNISISYTREVTLFDLGEKSECAGRLDGGLFATGYAMNSVAA